jgi:hypothetical protein
MRGSDDMQMFAPAFVASHGKIKIKKSTDGGLVVLGRGNSESQFPSSQSLFHPHAGQEP